MKGPKELEELVPGSKFQAVMIHIPQVDFDQSTPLEDELAAVMEPTAIGYHDGNEIGGGETTLWLFGIDAEAVFRHIEPTLRKSSFCNGARVVLRFGEFGSPEREFVL
jgi:hypothetical protein